MRRSAFFCSCVLLSGAVTVSVAPRAFAQEPATSAEPAPAQASTPARAPAAATAPETAQPTVSVTQPQAPHTLLDATPVKLRISQTISSEDAKVGQEVPFEVLEDVDVDGVPVIAKGATAIGTVTMAEPKRSMGRAGKLDISISYVRLRDEEKAALRAIKDLKGGGHVGAMTGAMVATSLVFFPAAPLFLFVHGKDITIPEGTELTAFVQGDMHLDMVKFGVAPMEGAASVAAPAPVSAPSPAAATSCALSVESTPAGADIAIDGSFVGSTPSTVTVASGSHQIVISKKGFADWTRTINVTGGTIHVAATLESAPN